MMTLTLLTEDQRDCLQEVANIAMGLAADSLARLLGAFVTLSVPKIRTLDPDEVRRFVRVEGVSAIRQAFHDGKAKDRLRGEALAVFGDLSFREFGELLDYDDPSGGSEQELLLDIANVLTGACLTGIADQLGEELVFSPPSALGGGPRLERLFESGGLEWETALSVEINFRLENRSFRCDLVLLMPDAAISYLAVRLDWFLASI